MASKKEIKLDGTSQQEHVEGEKLDGTSQQDHVDGEGYHIENHTTIYTEHEVEIDGVQLKERKETTTVTDDNEVNLGKTVIKHVRSIKGNAEIWKQDDTRSLMCFKRDRDSQDSKDDLQDSPDEKEVSGSSQEDIYESVGEREGKELSESDEEVTQTVTIYQRMVLNDDGEEEEGEQTVETELSDQEVAKFLELWNRLWHPKISDEQVQEMIDDSIDESGQQQEDSTLNDAHQVEAKTSKEESIDKEEMTVSAVSRDTNLDSDEKERYVN